ncbi:hypothetical protein RchiOBHm_Chr4g0419531 [Rosa chinensis]|uniref:Uncharacterized protein n=1 Tax=Rosa chinensis TaxID=74649 RepID=A0A2P6QXM4_ROSCH|nr:hypothetical protein RchiOBHm_Chr4g0419531 [Rosa chinensis]
MNEPYAGGLGSGSWFGFGRAARRVTVGAGLRFSFKLFTIPPSPEVSGFYHFLILRICSLGS